MVPDLQLQRELGADLLKPLTDYDERHNTGYVQALELYLACGGSIKEVSEKTYTHRNTVIYRINSIKNFSEMTSVIRKRG